MGPVASNPQVVYEGLHAPLTRRMAAPENVWERIAVPINEDWRENEFEMVNPVDVAEMFAATTGLAAYTAQEAEEVTERIRNLENTKSKKQRKVTRIRRTIFADHYAKLTKSAGTEVQDAFVLSMADAEQQKELLTLEEEIDGLDDNIAPLVNKRDKLLFRLKMIEKNMEYARHFLDFEKLEKKIHAAGRGMRV